MMTCISPKIQFNAIYLKILQIYLTLLFFFLKMNDVYISEYIKTYDINCTKEIHSNTHAWKNISNSPNTFGP
jgi:hypothetical protein